MKKKVSLFLNHQPGVQIAEFFASRLSKEEIVAIYLVEKDLEIEAEIKNALAGVSPSIFYGKSIFKDSDHIRWVREQKIDWFVTVYWPWLLDDVWLSISKDSINFHPAFLPINRGWFPHVHSLIDGSKAGVTLHRMESRADAGPIWAQEEVQINITDTAKDIYVKLQSRIVSLFLNKWDGIVTGVIEPKSQNESQAVYHSKQDVDKLDFVQVDKKYTGREIIDLLRARSFGNRGFAYFWEKNKKVYLNIRLSHENMFE